MADYSPKDVFTKVLPEKFQANPNKVKNINASFLFKVTGDQGGTWLVDFKKSPPEIVEGDSDADCILEMSDQTFVDIIDGKMNAMQAFMTQKLKVPKGMNHAMKLQPILG